MEGSGCESVLAEALASAWEAFGQVATEELRSCEGAEAAEVPELAVAAYKACVQEPKDFDSCKRSSSLALEKMWQEKERRGWDHPAWSEAYVLCQLCAATGAFLGDPTDPSGAMRALDLALIMGAPQELAHPFLGPVERRLMESRAPEAAAPETSSQHSSDSSAPTSSSSSRRFIPESADHADCPYPLDGASSIPRVSAADLSHKSFKADYWNSDKPVIVTGAMDNWEALQRWRDLDWWVASHGHRTVPLEVGLHGKEGWHERTASVREFVSEFLGPSALGAPEAKVAYMAQHTLLDQIPSLRAAVMEPSYCKAASPDGSGIVNAWIGTGGTKTPLHFDSYDNFLCQVAGCKYVRLYAQSETSRLYVDRSSGKSTYTQKQNNISKVDVSAPNLEAFPDFATADFSDALLKPGEMLFIPAKYWHYVESLTPAVSVNFWF